MTRANLAKNGYRRCEEEIGQHFIHQDCGLEVECWAKTEENGMFLVWACRACNEVWDCASVPLGNDLTSQEKPNEPR